MSRNSVTNHTLLYFKINVEFVMIFHSVPMQGREKGVSGTLDYFYRFSLIFLKNNQ